MQWLASHPNKDIFKTFQMQKLGSLEFLLGSEIPSLFNRTPSLKQPKRSELKIYSLCIALANYWCSVSMSESGIASVEMTWTKYQLRWRSKLTSNYPTVAWLLKRIKLMSTIPGCLQVDIERVLINNQNRTHAPLIRSPFLGRIGLDRKKWKCWFNSSILFMYKHSCVYTIYRANLMAQHYHTKQCAQANKTIYRRD